MKAIGSETIIAVPEPELDEFGEIIEGSDEPIEVKGCAVHPAGTSEDSFRASTVTDDLVMYAPVEETVLKANMAITRRGLNYTVEGNPMPWLTLSGVLLGTQVNLKRVT